MKKPGMKGGADWSDLGAFGLILIGADYLRRCNIVRVPAPDYN